MGEKNLSAGQYLAFGGSLMTAAGGLADQLAAENEDTGQGATPPQSTGGPRPPFDWNTWLPWMIGGAVVVALIFAAAVKGMKQ